MLWAAIALPELPLSAVFRAGDEGPCAVFDGPENRPQLIAVNAAAAALGIRPGHAPAAAHALSAELRLRRRDTAAETALLEGLAAWAYGFSGMVALAAPDALLLEVGASLRLFRGWPALERRLREGLDELGHAHRLAMAPTPLGARVLADVADGTAVSDEGRLLTALGHVALGQAHLPDKTVAALAAMGLRRLRDLFRLPRPELARRVGDAVLAHLDRLRGSAADPRPLYRPPDRFASRIEFDREMDSTEALLFPLLRLTRELAAFLLARDGGVQQFELVFEHELHAQGSIDGTDIPTHSRQPTVGAAHGCDRGLAAHTSPPQARHPTGTTAGAHRMRDRVASVSPGDRDTPKLRGRSHGQLLQEAREPAPQILTHDGTIGSVTRIPVGLLEPVRAAEALFEFARGRLERIALPAPARAITLRADALPPFVPARRDLFDIRPGAGLDWPTLAERLRARLGDRAVRGFAIHPDHRPERAWREQQHPHPHRAGLGPPSRNASGTPRPSTPGARSHAPTTTQADPTVNAGATAASPLPHAIDPRPRPVWLLPRALPLRGQVARLLAGPERIETGWWDGYDVRRDYYVAELATGQRAWLYREAGGGDDWMLQGWFA